MDIKKGKSYLTLRDFESHPIWKFNDTDDLNYPVSSSEDLPEDHFDLRSRAKFVTASGLELSGFIVGVKNIFVIAICVGDQIFYFNRNLPEDYSKNFEKLGDILGYNLTISMFSPLKFLTDIDLKGFRNIEGEFDLLKKVTNHDRLDGV